MSQHRSSDRWVTPGVIVAALLVGALVVLAAMASVTYLAARGINPDPMLRVVSDIATAVGAIGTLLLQLVGRRTVTKIERNTGLLPAKVEDVASKVEDALWVDQHGTQQLPPVPPPVRDTQRHPFAPAHGGGPGGDGEI